MLFVFKIDDCDGSSSGRDLLVSKNKQKIKLNFPLMNIAIETYLNVCSYRNGIFHISTMSILFLRLRQSL